MDYQVLELIAPYLDKEESIFHSLVSKDWLQVVKDQPFKTPYKVLTTPTLLSYSYTMLDLVYNDTVAEAVLKIGDLETIKVLHKNYDLCKDKKYMTSAAIYGHLLVMKWLLDNGCDVAWNTFSCAAQNGNLENMKWLKDSGFGFGYNTFNSAAIKGNLETMKWLKDNGSQFDSYTFSRAAHNGNLENMKWLKDNDCQFGHDTYYYAIRNGNPDNMKWLEDNGCQPR